MRIITAYYILLGYVPCMNFGGLLVSSDLPLLFRGLVLRLQLSLFQPHLRQLVHKATFFTGQAVQGHTKFATHGLPHVGLFRLKFCIGLKKQVIIQCLKTI